MDYHAFEGYKYFMSIKRPICKSCNKNPCAINYVRVGITHYRSICDQCGRKKTKQKPRIFNWEKAGYKKKPTCDICGFKSLYPTQMTVFHIDGNLKNVEYSSVGLEYDHYIDNNGTIDDLHRKIDSIINL